MVMGKARLVQWQVVYAFWALIAGTNLKQFLAEVRHDIYTPYGQWLKDSKYHSLSNLQSSIVSHDFSFSQVGLTTERRMV